MGKQNFHAIYCGACDELGHRPTVKLSHFCSPYDGTKNYAGLIVYHHNGRFKWKNESGVANGYNCRAFYVLIQCTDEWSGQAFREAGQGRVHDKLYREMFGEDFGEDKTCCGGFAIQNGEKKYSSYWLNYESSSSSSTSRLPWTSDGSKYLSWPEKQLVDLAVDSWKTKGGGGVLTISDQLDNRLECSILTISNFSGTKRSRDNDEEALTLVS